jgi:hypothetical protein
MKYTVLTTFKYAGVLVLIALLQRWVLFYSPLNIPVYIPATPININGLLVATVRILILILMIKRIISEKPAFTIVELTLSGALAGLITEFVMQYIRSFEDENDRLYHFLYGLIGMTFRDLILAFLVAFQLKTRRTGQLLLLIVVCSGIYVLLSMLLKILLI